MAGALGPTNRTLSLSPDVNDPAFRASTFDEMRLAYAEQVRGLVDGGAHVLLVETIFDTLNAKAALFAIEEVFEEKGLRLPILISVTIVDRSGRTLSGQTVDAFWTSIAHARPLCVGVNCALGAAEMRPYVEELSTIADTYVSAYPNAGLPNAFGGYDEDPDTTARLLREFAEAGFVNLVGGCCGTTPDHIRAMARAMEGLPPRRVPARPDRFTRLAGLETLTIRPETNFVMIGERTNVTGSKRFTNLIKKGDLERRPRGGRRAGARRRQHHRRQHGRGHARLRAGHDDVPEPRGRRARDRPRPDHDRQLQVVGDRGRPQVRPGQGRRQLDLASRRARPTSSTRPGARSATARPWW